MSTSGLRKLITLVENKEHLDEGFLSMIQRASEKMINYFVRSLNALRFGQKFQINLNDWLQMNPISEAEKVNTDLKSVIGFYNEYSVAARLASTLEQSGVNIKSNVDVTLEEYANAYRQRILANQANFRAKTPDQVQEELDRVDEGSTIMAQKLYSEISESRDLKLVDVHIALVGESTKGSSKEDIKITVIKRDEGTVLETISASLKIYRDKSVNMANLTFASYITNIITGDKMGKGEVAVNNFLERYPEYKEDVIEVVNLYTQWPAIKREKGREEANKFMTDSRAYQKMRNVLFTRIFQDFYSSNRAVMNDRILKYIGLDGADEVYMLIGNKKSNMIAISSRTSEQFKKLYSNLKAGFIVSFTNPEANGCKMLFHTESGELIMSFSLGFKEGASIPHFWDLGDVAKN